MDEENIVSIKDCIRMRKIKELFLETIKYLVLKIWRIFYLSKADYLIFVSKVVLNEFKRYYWFSKKETFFNS